MRTLFIVSVFSFCFLGFCSAQFNQVDSFRIHTCEPISSGQVFLSSAELTKRSENTGLKNWILAKGKKTLRKMAVSVKRTKTQIGFYVRQWAMKSVAHPAVMRIVLANSNGEKNKKSIGFWSLMMYLASLFFLAFVPGFGLLILLASLVIAMIGTVRDKNGLAILVLVLGFVTLLFLLILALFQSLFVVLFFVG